MIMNNLIDKLIYRLSDKGVSPSQAPNSTSKANVAPSGENAGKMTRLAPAGAETSHRLEPDWASIKAIPHGPSTD